MTLKLKKSAPEPLEAQEEVVAEEGEIMKDRYSVVDFIGKEVIMKVDVGGRDMPFTGILLQISDEGFFYLNIGNKLTAFNGSRIINICEHQKVMQKPVVGPDGDIAAEHQKQIDAQKVKQQKENKLDS